MLLLPSTWICIPSAVFHALTAKPLFTSVTVSGVRDTESLLNVQDGNLCFRIAPSALVRNEVHEGDPCVGIVDKAALREGEAACVVACESDNAKGFVPLHRYIDNLFQYFAVRRARLRHREGLCTYRGYGILDRGYGISATPIEDPDLTNAISEG